jgi:hypothetical protein
LIILSATTEKSALELVRVQEKLGKMHPAPLFGFGGGAFVFKPELRQLIPGQYLGETISEGLQTVARLLK